MAEGRAWDDALLSQVEDAGLNASAPREQRWMDGWLVRYSPGKAKRARCVNAVAAGRLPLKGKLDAVSAVFAAAGLPMIFRITPFTLPAELDAALAERGYEFIDDTRVMVCPAWSIEPSPLPAGLAWQALDAARYAQTVGALRGSSAAQCRAHAERLVASPVVYRGSAIVRSADGQVLACGQYACEAGLVGLYDVFTREAERGQGLSRMLCERLLSQAASEGAKTAYLQVDGDNHPARHVYRRLGFTDAYAYHYRQRPAD